MVRNATIQELVGRAVIDSDFREILMSNAREIAQEFPLTGAEIELLESVKADSFALFAAELDCLLNGGQREHESETITGSSREPFDRRSSISGFNVDSRVEAASNHNVPQRIRASI